MSRFYPEHRLNIMKFNLKKAALLSEIIGGLAVVVTLIFLVFEIRNNTNSIQSQAYQNLIFELNDTRRDYFLDDISQIIQKRRTQAELSEDEQFKIAQANQIKWSVYETAYFAYKLGTLGSDGWSRFEIAICRNYEIDKDLWSIDRVYAISTALNIEFAAYVEELCT